MAELLTDDRVTRLRSVSPDAEPPKVAKKVSKKDLEEVHERALKRADDTYAFEQQNIANGRDDQRFYVGGIDQWDKLARDARTGRPMLTVNRLPAIVHQLTGTIRRETPAIKVLPAKGDATQDTAEVLNGLIRNIEAQSDADSCYCIAAENAAVASQGAFRIVTEYSSDDSFDQDIRIRPIRDPFGFMIDPLANLPDRSDMQFGWIFERISKADFKAKYPDATADDVAMNSQAGGFTWTSGDSIRIAEYWERTTEKITLYLLTDGRTVDKVPDGGTVRRSRTVERPKVCSYMMSGTEILSGPHEWPGKYIPICIVPGEEVTVDGSTYRKGMIRDAKDPQRVLNYARSAEAESIALQPKAPFVVTKKQINGYEAMWNRAGVDNLPYLLVNETASGLPQRAQPPVMSTGLGNLSMTAGQDLKDVTGIFDASLGAQSNETSGVAIRSRQQQGDTGTYLYLDNLRRAISYCGKILVDIIPKIYDGERIVRVLKENGGSEMTTINGPNPEDPEAEPIDLSVGEYDVVVSTGQSYLTQREERREALIGLTQNVPALGDVAADLLVDALDFPGGDEISKRLREKMGIGDDGEPLPQQAPPPDPSLVAKALVDGAKADLTKAQTEGQEIKNATDFVTLQATMAGLAQTMEAIQSGMSQMMAMQGGQGPQGAQQPPMGAQMPIPEGTEPPGPAAPQIEIPPGMAEGGEDTVVDMPEGAPV
jgi:hypothetical protein